MFTRTRWFAVGVVAGAGGAMYGFVRLRESRSRLAPDRVAESVVGTARTVGHGARRAGVSLASTWRDAVAEGRDAMDDAEARIIADLDRPPGASNRGGGHLPAQ